MKSESGIFRDRYPFIHCRDNRRDRTTKVCHEITLAIVAIQLQNQIHAISHCNTHNTLITFP